MYGPGTLCPTLQRDEATPGIQAKRGKVIFQIQGRHLLWNACIRIANFTLSLNLHTRNVARNRLASKLENTKTRGIWPLWLSVAFCSQLNPHKEKTVWRMPL